jgi:putative hemolysin
VSLSVWVGIALFLLGNALYVAAEFGAVGVRRSRVRRLAEDGNPLARRLLPAVTTSAGLDSYVGASQIGITLTSLVLGAFAQATVAVALAPILVEKFAMEPATAVSTAAIGVLVVLTAVQVVIGELVPKSLALQFPTETALATVLPMQWSTVIFRPFLAFLNGSANALLRLLGVHTTTHRHIHSPDEIELLIAESRDGGLLEPDELDRLRKALRLSRRSARDLMVPESRVTMINVDAPWAEVLRTILESGYSRLPVFRGTRQDVIGTLRVKDVVQNDVAVRPADAPRPSVERMVRPLPRIPHDMPADQVIAALRDARAHQGLVAGPNGEPIGLITIQDVLSAFLQRGPKPAEARS